MNDTIKTAVRVIRQGATLLSMIAPNHVAKDEVLNLIDAAAGLIELSERADSETVKKLQEIETEMQDIADKKMTAEDIGDERERLKAASKALKDLAKKTKEKPKE